MLVADPNAGVLVYDAVGNLAAYLPDGGALDAQADSSGNVFVANANFRWVDEFDAFGNFASSPRSQARRSAWPWPASTAPPRPRRSSTDYYAFHLDAGQTARPSP